MVDRNCEEFSVSLQTCFAFLFPSSAIRCILVSLREIMAISLIAKNAFTRIRINRTMIFDKISPPTPSEAVAAVVTEAESKGHGRMGTSTLVSPLKINSWIQYIQYCAFCQYLLIIMSFYSKIIKIISRQSARLFLFRLRYNVNG